jgi:hypothetical protein
MTEKYFWASEADNDEAEQYGPFNTAEEAETQALRLGWEWVAIHTVDEFGTFLDTPSRFYQPEGLRMERKPADVEAIRRMVLPAPMTEDEVKFFAAYEKQMSAPASKLGEIHDTFSRIKRQLRKSDGKSKTGR